jgi:hypothetical protein
VTFENGGFGGSVSGILPESAKAYLTEELADKANVSTIREWEKKMD